MGPQLKAIRDGKGYTVWQAALQSDLSSSYWSQVENKKRSVPKPKILRKMAKGLRMDENDIFQMAELPFVADTPDNFLPFSSGDVVQPLSWVRLNAVLMDSQ